MPHIHTEEGQHDHTVSAFIVRTDRDEPRLMLHKHRRLGAYMQFGGHIELGEHPWQALIHEVKEESGYEIDQLKILQPAERINQLANSIAHPIPFSYNTHLIDTDPTHYHTDAAYAFTTRQEPKFSIEHGESEDIRLFTRTELENFGTDEMPENVRQLSRFVLRQCLPYWGQRPTSDYKV